jgi:hypothetical protein
MIGDWKSKIVNEEFNNNTLDFGLMVDLNITK